jgi:hypothetical protein
MCRSPLAYGHATATRIFLGFSDSLTGANDKESLASDPAGAEAGGADRETRQQQRRRECRERTAASMILGRRAIDGSG